MEWQTLQIYSRRYWLPIDVAACVGTLCIDICPGLLVVCVGRASYPLERIRSVGSSLPGRKGSNLNYSRVPVHNLRGPFKYGYYERIWCYVGFGISYSISRCHPKTEKARNYSFISYSLFTCPFAFPLVYP
jgi:hypothetical protein